MASASATKRGAQRRGKKPWARREQGLKKKAAELSTLCGVDVCIVGYNDAGDFFSWPDDLNEVERIAGRLKEQQGIGAGQGPARKRKMGASTSALTTAPKRGKGASKAPACPQNSGGDRRPQSPDVQLCLDVLDAEEPMAFWRRILEMTSGVSGPTTDDLGLAEIIPSSPVSPPWNQAACEGGASAIRPVDASEATTGILVAAGVTSMIPPPLLPPLEISDDLLPVGACWGSSPWNGEYAGDFSATSSWPFFQRPAFADVAFRCPSPEELLWGVPSMSGGRTLEMEAQRSCLCSCQAALGVPGLIPFPHRLLPPPAALPFSAANLGWTYF